MLKKSIAWLMLAFTFFSAFFRCFAEEEDSGLTKEVYINVAQNKPVKGGRWSDTYPLTNLVDGNRQTFVVPSGTYTDNEDGKTSTDGSFWFSIDLQHRYNIERIEFYDRYNQADEGGRRYFKILAANEPDFSDAVVLSEMGAPDDTLFPDNGPYLTELDGTRAYRYVKMQRTGGYYYGYSEFKVFAKQTVTEVSRNKTAIADEEAEGGTYAAGLAVNGTNMDSRDAWVATSQAYHYWQVDLEYPQYIGYVEMEGRNGADDPNTRHSIAVYGSENPADADIMLKNSNLKEYPEYLKLTEITNNYISGEAPFPKYDMSKPESMYYASCDESRPVRYVIHKKTWQMPSALGQFRAFTVNPRLTASGLNGRYISLEFSDAMDAASVNDSAVRIKRASSGEEIPFTVNISDEYTFELEMQSETFGDVLNIEFSSDVRDLRGVAMQPQTVSFETAPAVEVRAFGFIDELDKDGNLLTTIQNAVKAGARVTFYNNMSEPSDIAEAVVIAGLFDPDNTLVAAGEIRKSFDPQSQVTLYTGADLSQYEDLTGYTFSVFIWNNFRDMKPWADYRTLN
ncbi:MAG: hypothetical protein J6N52_12280 [Clostridia bacterium]|nr:hypothetical protein [Clostridia bacterium]